MATILEYMNSLAKSAVPVVNVLYSANKQGYCVRKGKRVAAHIFHPQRKVGRAPNRYSIYSTDGSLLVVHKPSPPRTLLLLEAMPVPISSVPRNVLSNYSLHSSVTRVVRGRVVRACVLLALERLICSVPAISCS